MSLPAQVVGIRAAQAQVTEFLTCTIAAHFMANRIVVPVVDPPPDSDSRQDVHEALGAMPLFKWSVCCVRAAEADTAHHHTWPHTTIRIQLKLYNCARGGILFRGILFRHRYKGIGYCRN